MRPDESSTGRPNGATITYEPGDGSGLWKLTIEVPVHAPAPREHLITAAAEQRRYASRDDITWSVDSVAERHLHETTHAKVSIRDDAQQIRAETYDSEIPSLPGSRAPGTTRPLTADQKALLPNLMNTVRDVIPPELHPYADDIAQLAARTIPSQADVLRAYQRTSVAEVLKDLDSYDEPMEPDTSVHDFLTALNFPAHPSTALRPQPDAPSTASKATASAHNSAHLER